MDEHNVDWSKVRRLEIHVGDEKKIVEQDGDSLCLRGLDLEEANTCLAQYGDSLEMLRICSGDISGLSFPEGLRVLDLSGMTLATLPESIRKLKKLKKLDLSHTHISQLPEWLPELGLPFSREWLSSGIILYGAETDGVDMSIFDQSQEVIHQWFGKRNEQYEVPLNEIKVIFLGNGDVGKTHTIARLMKDGEKHCDSFTGGSTPGIAISDKTYTIDGQDIQVHFWDFGGQDILYSMHRMFMTERAIYVVMVDARTENCGAQATEWLDTIKSFAGDAPVLLAVNKIDQNSNASLDKWGLMEKYENLKQIIYMSALCDEPEKFNSKFTASMVELIRQSDVPKMKWPKKWKQVKDVLQHMTGSYIRSREYEKICRDCEVDSVGDSLLKWFNDLGVCFHHEDKPLQDYVVLHPEWITNAVYTILLNKRNAVRNGLIPLEEIFDLLTSERSQQVTPGILYTWQDMDYILGVVRRFCLSYSVDAEHEFFPMLCSENSSAVAKEYENCSDALEFHMEFPYLPNNVLHRLMVERYRELDSDNVWLTGARFRRLGSGLSAVVHINDNRMRFYVRSENRLHVPNTYLHELVGSVERICQELKLEIGRGLVIYKERGKSTEIDHETLVYFQETGKSAIYSREFRKMVSIEDILGQSFHQIEHEKEILLTDMAKACMQMQETRLMHSASENDRNTELRDALRAMGYLVADQSFSGPSHDGKHAGEMDFVLYRDVGQPWAVCEGLRIRNTADMRNWNNHMSKLLTNYNASGLPIGFLICYVDCGMEQYHRLWSQFNEHMRQHDPRYGRRMDDYAHVFPLKEITEYLRIARCSYDIGGRAITIYHYFVFMGEQSDAALSRKENLRTQWEKAIEEAANLRTSLTRERQAREAAEKAARSARIELEEMVSAVQHKDEEHLEAQKSQEQMHAALEAASQRASEKQKQCDGLMAMLNNVQQKLVETENRCVESEKAFQQVSMSLSEQTELVRVLEEALRKQKADHYSDTEEDEEETPDDMTGVTMEYRVILMGDSEAGKSQILYRLRHPTRAGSSFKGNVTPGIDIASRCYTINEERVRVNFWDFGGQEILHSIHRLFLTKNTMYVIVLNTRNDNQDDQAQFWLRFVEIYATGAPVMLVLNKIDQNPSAELNMPVIRREFEEGVTFKGVLKTKARDWDPETFRLEFEKKITDCIGSVLTKDDNSFSEQELQIRDALCARGAEQVLEMEDYYIIGGEIIGEKVDQTVKTKLNKLAMRFNDAGMFVYFDTRDHMLLNPEWITDAISKVMKERRKLAGNGIVSCEDIEETVCDTDEQLYRKRHVDFMLKIMRMYGLSFEYKVPRLDSDCIREQEFIPMLCGREEPSEVTAFIEQNDVLQMQISYSYLPAGIIYQLMADLHKEKELNTKNVWLSGAMFHNKEGCTVVVSREKNKLSIYGQAENRGDALNYMLYIKKRIEGTTVGDMYRFKALETRLGYQIAGETEFFDYERLELSKKENLEQVMSKRKKKAISVLDILEQTDRSAEQARTALLRRIALACTQLQQRASSFKLHLEDDRNTYLYDALRNMDYDITDQTLVGSTLKGTRPNKLDLLVYSDSGEPWTIIEALNVSPKTGMSYWNSHLEKLLGRYNVWGLRALVLICYVDCEDSKFKDLYQKFSKQMREYSPAEAARWPDTYQQFCPFEEEKSGFYGEKSIYIRHGKPVTVYHYFVYLGNNVADEAESKDNSKV